VNIVPKAPIIDFDMLLVITSAYLIFKIKYLSEID
jgi:hypothetical protein